MATRSLPGWGPGPRVWIALVVLLALVPTLGLALYTGLIQWLGAAAGVEADARRLARLAASGQERLLEGLRPLLAAIAASPEVRQGDQPACGALLADLLRRAPHHANLGAVSRDGALVCSAIAPGAPLSLADRRFFRHALETGDITPGDYQVEPVSGRPAVTFGYPVIGDDGQVRSVVFAALDVAWLNQVAAEVPLPETASLTVLADDGVIVARSPEARRWVGMALPGVPIVRAMLARPDGVAEVLDLDGVRRVYAFTRLGGTPPSGLVLGIGIARDVALADANRRLLAYLGLGLLAAVALATVWVTGRWLAARSDSARRGEPARQALMDQVSDLVTQRAREVALLSRLNGLLQVCVTVDEAAAVVSRLLEAFFPREAGALFVVEPARRAVERVALWGASPRGGRPLFTPDDCWALRGGQPYVVEDTATGLACPHLTDPLPRAYACVPLTAQGEALGVLHLQGESAPGRAFASEAKQRLLATVPEQLGLALANLRLREKLRLESIRDGLTGLFNRRYLEETLARELARAERDRHPVGVLLLDVDHFKRFNDRFGHDGGDAVLAALGGLLRESVRGGDIACRHGGEEFVLILPGADVEETRRRADDLRETVRALAVSHRGQLLDPVTLSIGIAAYPEHGAAGDALLRAADAALYRAKHEGRDRAVVAE